MAVLGHTTHQQAALYTRAADRAGMAEGALARLFGDARQWLAPIGELKTKV